MSKSLTVLKNELTTFLILFPNFLLSKETNEVSNDFYMFQECDKNNIYFIEVFTGPKYTGVPKKILTV